RSPLRPVAVTVRVNDPDGGGGGGGDDGVTVKVAVLIAPPKLPVIVTGVDALTAFVAIVKLALVAPARRIDGHLQVYSVLNRSARDGERLCPLTGRLRSPDQVALRTDFGSTACCRIATEAADSTADMRRDHLRFE